MNVEHIPHDVRSNADKHCIPSKYQSPLLNSPLRPFVVSKGTGLSANRPTAITPKCIYRKQISLFNHHDYQIPSRCYIPHIPHTPCTDEAPTGSSTAHLSNSGIDTQVKIAPIAPINIASHARYKKQPAVIDTNDPRMPLIKSKNK